jgi:H+-translocating NAD(P) transhydrogenase subunit alpha
VNIPSAIPYHASQMLSANITALIRVIAEKGEISLNLEDDLIRESLVTHSGQVVHSRILDLLAASRVSGEVNV